jgi:GNAT superfamily N-acetyltransferase
MKIVRAREEDSEGLSSVAHEAKAHWGYPESWLLRWADALTITPAYIRANLTYKLVSDEGIIGFCSLVLRGSEARLDHLWILPSQMGKGGGRLLFGFAEKVARTSGAGSLTVECDPHAEAFYVHMGAIRYGEVSATMDGTERFLPLLEKAL